MTKRWGTVLLAALAVLCALPASAAIQYFGYVLADQVDALEKTKSFVNFTHIDAETPQDPVFLSEVNAINQRGVKVTIDVGKIFWCNAPAYDVLCTDWQARWNQWKTYNASILVPSKTIALAVRDEPLLLGVNLSHMETAAAYIKSDPALASWLKIFWVEAACKVAYDQCWGQPTDYNGAFWNATSYIPSIDWVGLSHYWGHPTTDGTFTQARDYMRQKYPNKGWLYVADGFYTGNHEIAFGQGPDYMAQIAQEWYYEAASDPAAVLFGVFIWPSSPGSIGSDQLPCNVIQEHRAISSALIGNTGRGLAPIGSWSVDSSGVITGQTCDPNYCAKSQRLEVRIDGVLHAYVYPPNDGVVYNSPSCGTGISNKFKYTLPRNSQGKTISVFATDVDSPGATLPSTCPQSPNCSWTSHIKYYGYSGSADDTTNRGLDETKAFTNFSHVVQEADPANTYVRDRVTAMNARGLKATIDLGKLFWCGTNWRTLCPDWQTRWNTWKTTNASILTSDKVLVLVPRAQPFNYNVNMAQYDQLTAFLKADATVGSWVKIWLIEAACVVANGNCGAYPGSNAWNNYTGTLPNTDWIGVDWYSTYPATDSTYQSAINKVKTKYPSKPRVYVMDGFWDSSHVPAFSTINGMKNAARAWYDIAHNDSGAILLGIYAWMSFGSGVTGARDFPCYVLSEHRDIGREILNRQRPNTAQPVGRLDNIYDSSGFAWGYACDPDGSICENPMIDFKADGVTWSSTMNYPSRNYFLPNGQCGTGVMYRFEAYVNPGASGRNVTAFARDLNSGGTTLTSLCAENPACKWFTSYFSAWGYMEAITPGGIAAGWVCDPDAPHLSSQVRLALDDGTPIGTFTTNLASEQAVADECHGGYLHRFSVQLPAWAHYRTIQAFSQDFTSGEVQIPWLCEPGGWECVWY